MARRYGDPFKGNVLNRLSHFKARPINRDALRVVEADRDSKKARPRKAEKAQPTSPTSPPKVPQKSVFKKQVEEARRKACKVVPVPAKKKGQAPKRAPNSLQTSFVARPMSDIHQLVTACFAAQGFMHTLGARLVSIAPGEVHIALTPSQALTQQDGFVHAGVLTAILDSACGYAAMTVAPGGGNVLTVEFKVNLLRPALAEEFVAIGQVVKPGKTLTVCTAEVIGTSSGKACTVAIMQATIANVRSGLPGP